MGTVISVKTTSLNFGFCKLQELWSLDKLARLIGSNKYTLRNVEKGSCLETTYLTIIRKMSLEFNDIDDDELLKNYRKWLKENDIKIK